MDTYGMTGWWGMGFGPLFMLVIVIAVIALTVMLIKAIIGSNTGSNKITAMEILEERFARGEIDDTEFQNRRKELER